MVEVLSMIKTYYIEDLTVDEVDELVERGVCFDITSKNALLSERRGRVNRDAFWSSGAELSESLRQQN